MLTVFSGKIYKIIYFLGGRENVYSVGNRMEKAGIEITRIEKDVEYSLQKTGERVIIYAKSLNGGEEFIYDEVYNAPMSIRRDFQKFL